MPRKHKELQWLLKVTSDFGEERKLTFNPAKSAVIVFSREQIGTGVPHEIQGKELPLTSEYKYLGVVLGSGQHYLRQQETVWQQQAKTTLHQLHAQTIWGFNRFEMTKVQWKATGVPKMTYANSTTVMSYSE